MIVIFSLLAMFILIYFYPEKVGVSPDSVFYIEGAKNLYRSFEYKSMLPRNFLNGPRNEDKFPEELLHTAVYNKKEPIFHFPPATSFIYSLSMYLSNNLLNNIKILNILFFFIFVLSFIFIIYFETRHILITTLLFLYVVLTLQFTEKFYWAWSEPIYVVFNFLCLFTLIKFIQTSHICYFIFSWITCTLSYLTRYQGMSNILAGAVIIFLYLKNKKLLFSLVWLFLSSVPLIILRFFGYTSDFYFTLHLITIPTFEGDLSDYSYDWINYFILFENKYKNFIRTTFFNTSFFLLTLLAITSFLFIRNYKFWGSVIFISLQATLIFSAWLLADTKGPARYPMSLLPLIAYTFAIYATTFHKIREDEKQSVLSFRKFSSGLLIAFLLLVLPFKAIDFCRIIENKYKKGVWFTDTYYFENTTLKFIKLAQRHENKKILFFSNDHSLSYSSLFHNEIVVFPLPYTTQGLKKFIDLSQNIEFYIFWKRGEKGLRIFDSSSKHFINYEYDVDTLDTFLNKSFLKKISVSDYIIYKKIQD